MSKSKSKTADFTVGELIEKYRSEVLAKEPYRMNLIELLHANENAHTRILVELLRYNHSDSNFGFAKSFLRKFIREIQDVAVPVINEQIENIDAIIGEEGKYAVVIENKINWAQDQDRQIERYVKSAKELFSVDYDKIYCVYLTDNGTKQVSDVSLTRKARKLLGMCDEHPGRFIKLNYKDHILRWIIDDVLPNCRHGETQTISALEQYVDYLERRLVDSAKSDPNEELFVEEICPHTLPKVERYKQFKNYRQLLEDDLPKEAKPDDAFTLDKLRALIERKMDALHDSDFSIDPESAVSKMVSRIWDWGRGIDYYGPQIYKETDVIVSQVRLKNGARMKFDINVENDLRLFVQFFDNDGKDDVTPPLESRYPGLVKLFSELFGTPMPEDTWQHWIGSYSAPMENVSQLDKFLSTKAMPFMRQFREDIVK